MKHIVTLNRNELLCAITDYLERRGYKPLTNSYYPWVTFDMGTIEIGSQREPESISTVVSVKCTVQN